MDIKRSGSISIYMKELYNFTIIININNKILCITRVNHDPFSNEIYFTGEFNNFLAIICKN